MRICNFYLFVHYIYNYLDPIFAGFIPQPDSPSYNRPVNAYEAAPFA